MRSASPPKARKQFVLITGLSGSGKGSVLKTFEDLGFQCIDNLPIDLIPQFAQMWRLGGSRMERAAVVVDIREGQAISQLPMLYQTMARDNLKLSLVFLEASDRALIRRFEETRRPHPLGRDLPVREGIRLERTLLKPMRQLADAVIDTTRLNVHELRDLILTRFGAFGARKAMLVSVLSFGYRYGVPLDADLVFDVRFLPNPHFVPALRPFTGKDPRVAKYILSFPQTQEFIDRTSEMLVYLLPHYVREGKSYLTIGFGCTGGQHRSVMIAEAVSRRLAKSGYRTKVVHRDCPR
jgi:RNase adapter protein RapZ